MSLPRPLPRTTLGDGLSTTALGFGAMSLADVYGPVSESEAFATLSHAVDSGIDLIDTADRYGNGSNERLISRLLATRRDEVALATKFGIVENKQGAPVIRNDPAYVRESCDGSLARLGIDRIDLYYLHRRQVSVPIEEVVGAMADLVREGKVAHLGLCEVTADELRTACAVHPIAAVQSEWSLWSRDVERRVVPAAAELGVGMVPYSPLGRGFLTGSITSAADVADDLRGRHNRFSGEAFASNLALVEEVRWVAESCHATPAQVALGWLRQRGQELGVGVVPIPGTRRTERVEENLGALTVSLDEDTMRQLDTLAHRVVGPRSGNPDPNWTSETREG